MLWGFRELGINAEAIFNYDAAKIIEEIETKKPELFLTLGPPLDLMPEVMEYIGKRSISGMKHIHWDTDGISSTYYNSVSGDGIEMDAIYGGKPDFVLSVCPEMQAIIKNKGFPCEIMHYAYSPVFHRPMPELFDESQKIINLIGHSYIGVYAHNPEHYRYKSLEILLKPLLESKYTVHIYGDIGYLVLIKSMFNIDFPPENLHGTIPYQKTCAVYNSGFLNIVMQNHNETITKRTFEILGSGSFAISSDNAILKEFFIPGRHLAVSGSPEETLEHVEYYGKNMAQWREVRKNAFLGVQNHTYKERASFITDKFNKL